MTSTKKLVIPSTAVMPSETQRSEVQSRHLGDCEGRRCLDSAAYTGAPAAPLEMTFPTF